MSQNAPFTETEATVMFVTFVNKNKNLYLPIV